MHRPDSPKRIFLSYSRKDGTALAHRLQESLAQRGYVPWLDTQCIHGGASWTKEIETALDEADVILAVLTPRSYVSGICRAEQLRAMRKNKQVIPVLGHHGTDIPLHLEAKHYRDFTTESAYEQRFDELMKDIKAGESVALADKGKEKFRRTYVTAPPLPINFVERPEDLIALRNALITDGESYHIALTALEGMGGIGKTLLAQAICHDHVVNQAFPDGIIWVTIGKESLTDTVTRLREIAKALNDDLSLYENEMGSRNQYRTVVGDKAALIVVDDVWKAADLEPFLAESSCSRLLFTTRDASIAADVGAKQHTLGLLSEGQSREVLARWSGINANSLPLPEADNLIRECGRLPLALAMVGARLRNASAALWGYYLQLLENANLEEIKANFPNYHPNMFRAIQVSVNGLEPTFRKRYLALGVLLEEMSVRPAIQQTLWSTNQGETAITTAQFINLSLAQCDGNDGSIRLHDLQLDYVRTQYPDREALRLIHSAVRLSAHVIGRDPTQFSSQVVGRLLPHESQLGIQNFVKLLGKGQPRPFLRLLWPTLIPAGGWMIRTLENPCEYLNFRPALAITPDGRHAVSASYRNTLTVWDLNSGCKGHTLQGHSDLVCGVAVTPDGRQAVSASYDCTLRVWDLESGYTLRTLRGHSQRVEDVAIASNGRLAVSASSDHTLRVWDIDTGEELCTLRGHTDHVNGVAITPNGQQVISASADCTLKIWDLSSGQELATMKGHSKSIENVAVTQDGRRVVTTSYDGAMKVWDLERRQELRTLHGSSGCAAITPDSRRVVSTSEHALKVWELDSGKELATLEGHSKNIRNISISQDGRYAVSIDDDKTLKVWGLDRGQTLLFQPGHRQGVLRNVNGVSVSPDSRRAVSASHDETLKVWDLSSSQELATLKGHSFWVTGVAITPDGCRVVSASHDRTLKVWSLDTGQELATLRGHRDNVVGVATTQDGQLAVSASHDKTLKVWNLKTGRVLRTLKGHTHVVTSVAVMGDGQRAISTSEDGTLRVWELVTGRSLLTLRGHSAGIWHVALFPDSRRAISASFDHTLKIWNLDEDQEIRTLRGHTSMVYGVAVSQDGKRAVSASADHTLKLWDVETGVNLATFTCESWTRCCAFVGLDGILAGDDGGRLYLLKIEE